MWEKTKSIRIDRKTIIYIVVVMIALASVTPVLADYLGPNRTVTETTGVCKVILYECQYVSSKQDWRYRIADTWSCSNESKPWQSYPDQPSSQGCFSATSGDQYWAQEDTLQTLTTTYPPATINSMLQNCSENNGWCLTSPQVSLSAVEPVSGYSIAAIEGSLNGQTFACLGSPCDVPLSEGDNNLSFWALSTWGDSSTMGTLTAKVDSQLPVINGSLSGITGSNGWYLNPISFNGSASDSTSGLESFVCTLDGVALASCSSIIISGEGAHTLVLTARDNAGNLRTWTRNVLVDTLSPSLTAGINGSLGSNNWFNTATLNASAVDPNPGSGLAIFEYNLDKTSWQTFPSSGIQPLPEGKHSVDIRATDNAGHLVSASKTFWLDTMQPTVNVNATGTVGANNWFITSPSITASAQDDTSGINVFEYSLDNHAWTNYTTPLTLANGSHSLSFWVQDQSGLSKQVDRTYQVDTRVPQIAGSISGVPGLNGWYVSNVTLSASASDPAPGSGLETFNYLLNGAPAVPYTTDLRLDDGQHTIQLLAQDQAGLKYSIEQNIKVDTAQPSLGVSSTLPRWIKNNVVLSGIAHDQGSGLSKVEISLNGGQTWQPVSGTTSWSYGWDTQSGPDDSYNVHIRVTDNAGLKTEETINVGVDNHAPKISLPSSWYQWESVTLDIWDNVSGVAEARVEISDPDGRWPRRVIRLNPNEFPLEFKWDRRFGDNTIAPLGTYNVKVTAFDKLGNIADQSATIKILLDIIPAGPAATPQPYLRPEDTPATVSAVAPIVVPTETPAPMVSVFGEIEPTANTDDNSLSTTPATPHATPVQTSVLEWLESIFVPGENSTEQVTEIRSSDTQPTPNEASSSGSNILWGATAAAVIGATTAYIIEENRKQKEEKEWQQYLEAQARAEEKEGGHAKRKALKLEKLENQWALEDTMEEARLLREQKLQAEHGDRMDAKMALLEAEDDAKWMASQVVIQQRAKEKELQEGLAAYYNGRKAGESTTPNEPSWWQKTLGNLRDTREKTIHWIDQNQTEFALGVGIVVGVAAIVLSGGFATPLVAAGWTAGAAALAGGTVALTTIGLNSYYGRNWDEKVVNNLAVAGLGAAVVTGAWFVFQLGSMSAGAYCAVNPVICSRIDPVFKAIDAVEELSLNIKAAYYTWRGDEIKAMEATNDLYTEYIDGGMPGNYLSKQLGDELGDLSKDAIDLARKHGNDVLPLLIKYGDDGLEIIQKYGDDGIRLLKLVDDAKVTKRLLDTLGPDALNIVQKYGNNGIRLIKIVEDPTAAKAMLETLDGDVLEYAAEQGPDALIALSRWKIEDLKEHGVELALRAKRDAQVLADVKKLVGFDSIDPQNLTEEQLKLINEIAANSTQYADEGQIVLGKWVDISNGFVERAKDTGSVHYNPHPDMWNLLGDLGKEKQNDVAWLINKQVVQNGINKGLPFEYTLNGVPEKSVEFEDSAIEAIFSGKTDQEILDALDLKIMPIRIKELKELQQAGYEYTFDEVNNSYIFTLP